MHPRTKAIYFPHRHTRREVVDKCERCGGEVLREDFWEETGWYVDRWEPCTICPSVKRIWNLPKDYAVVLFVNEEYLCFLWDGERMGYDRRKEYTPDIEESNTIAPDDVDLQIYVRGVLEKIRDSKRYGGA